jgi:hypothetical protein
VQLSRSHPGRKVVANYDATNSRFSRSTTQPITADKIPCTLAQACKLFPSLKNELMRCHPRGLSLNTRLVPGPAIEEHAFKGPTVEFGGGIIGEFAFTLWYRRTQHQKLPKKPYASEISFRCNTDDDGLVGLSAARRAHLLFVAMQKKLAGWVDTDNSSKTALALP